MKTRSSSALSGRCIASPSPRPVVRPRGPRTEPPPRARSAAEVASCAEPLGVAGQFGRLKHESRERGEGPQEPDEDDDPRLAAQRPPASRRGRTADPRASSPSGSRPACPRGNGRRRRSARGRQGRTCRASLRSRRPPAAAVVSRIASSVPSCVRCPGNAKEASARGQKPSAPMRVTRASSRRETPRAEPPQTAGEEMVGDVGIEPTTSCLSSRRSPN